MQKEPLTDYQDECVARNMDSGVHDDKALGGTEDLIMDNQSKSFHCHLIAMNVATLSPHFKAFGAAKHK